MFKQECIQFVVRHDPAHAPERPGTHVRGIVGLVGYVEGIVPLLVECRMGYGLLVGEIHHLLDDQYPEDRIEFFRRSPEAFREERGEFVHGQLTQDMFTEEAGP